MLRDDGNVRNSFRSRLLASAQGHGWPQTRQSQVGRSPTCSLRSTAATNAPVRTVMLCWRQRAGTADVRAWVSSVRTPRRHTGRCHLHGCRGHCRMGEPARRGGSRPEAGCRFAGRPPVGGRGTMAVVASPDLPGAAGRGARAFISASPLGPSMRSGQPVAAGPRVGCRARREVGTLSDCRLAGVAAGLGMGPGGVCGLGMHLFDDACCVVGSTTVAPRQWRALTCPAAETRRP